MKIVPLNAELMFVTPDAEKIIELAGRVAYQSEDLITPERSGKFVKMLIARTHFTPLEMADAAINFTVDRGVSHEIVRHRIASYVQESTRYCNYSKG